MEGHPVIMDQMNQYYEMAILPKASQMFNAILMKNANDIPHRDRKIIHLEAQKILNSQSNPKQKRARLEVSQYLTPNHTTES
jgi:hypothetical protein